MSLSPNFDGLCEHKPLKFGDKGNKKFNFSKQSEWRKKSNVNFITDYKARIFFKRDLANNMIIQGRKFFLVLLLLAVCIICANCRHKESASKTSSALRIGMEGDPQTLDPRRVRDLSTVSVIHMLYEGLMRTQADNDQPFPALAEKITISPDKKVYTFQLRASAWSDGQPVTAYDFENTWKSLLHPQFPSPNAYQLYVIRGARTAKEGQTSSDQIGIYAQDASTLIVELEQPTPYFLQLLATHFFYPVHPSLCHQSVDSVNLSDSQILTNGPFKLEKWRHHNELTAIPNPYYWDKEHVYLKRIHLIILDNSTALQLFQRGEVDWAGSPLASLSIDALSLLKKQGKLKIMPAAGIYLFRINTERPPFNHAKMRQAFALALNRKDLVEHVLQGNQEPALGIIPPNFIEGQPLFQDHHVSFAKQLLQEALEEQGLTLENLPPISIDYASGERAHKIAQVVQQQWKENLGIHVTLHSNEAKIYYDRLKTHDYQLGIGSWFADIQDPISFLEVFKFKDNGTNNTQWENSHYITLLSQSSLVNDSFDRQDLLKEAEKVLIQEMPIIPLFYASYNYVTNDDIKDVYFSKLGYLDLKKAYWEVIH